MISRHLARSRRGLLAGASAIALAPALRAQQPGPTHLDTIVVASRATPGSAGRTVDVITREMIARSPARTLSELLGTRVSVDAYTRSPAQADVAIRGSTAEQVVILVNGARISDAQSTHYALDVGVPLDAIERIEILRGPGAALYGPNAIGGVIDIVTRDAASSPGTASHVSARAGSFGTVDLGADAMGSLGRTSISGAVQGDRSDGHRPDTDYRVLQTRLDASRTLGVGRLAADASLGVRDFGASQFYSPYPSSERTGAMTGGARWTGALSRWTVTADAHTRLHTDRFTLIRTDPSVYENRHRSWQTAGSAGARTSLSDALALALGAEAEHDQLSSARLGGRREWRGALFAEATFTPDPRVQMTVSGRDDHASTFGDFVSPSLAVSAMATRDLTMRASGARGFRSPTWTERYYTDPANVGNPALRPERFWNGEIGAHYTPHAAADVSLAIDGAAFVRQAFDLIDWVRPAGSPTVPWHIENVDRATFRGIEGSISAMPAPRVHVSLAGSGIAFGDAAPSALVGKYALRPVTRQLTATVSAPLVGASDVTVDAMHARRASESGYATVDATVGIPVAGVRLTLEGTNLTNASWLDASGMPSQGRALFVGVRW